MEGSTSEVLHQPSRPWVAAGALVRGALQVTNGLSLELELGAEAPLIRETFVYRPSGPIYRAPAVVMMGGAGLAVRIP